MEEPRVCIPISNPSKSRFFLQHTFLTLQIYPNLFRSFHSLINKNALQILIVTICCRQTHQVKILCRLFHLQIQFSKNFYILPFYVFFHQFKHCLHHKRTFSLHITRNSHLFNKGFKIRMLKPSVEHLKWLRTPNQIVSMNLNQSMVWTSLSPTIWTNTFHFENNPSKIKNKSILLIQVPPKLNQVNLLPNTETSTNSILSIN